jgi:hypothetical protein
VLLLRLRHQLHLMLPLSRQLSLAARRLSLRLSLRRPPRSPLLLLPAVSLRGVQLALLSLCSRSALLLDPGQMQLLHRRQLLSRDPLSLRRNWQLSAPFPIVLLVLYANQLLTSALVAPRIVVCFPIQLPPLRRVLVAALPLPLTPRLTAAIPRKAPGFPLLDLPRGASIRTAVSIVRHLLMHPIAGMLQVWGSP